MPLEQVAYDSQGRQIVLAARLGRGGEGEVFTIAGAPGLCAKLLHAPGRTRAKLDKVEAMVAAPPAGALDLVDGLAVLTWPRSVLHSRPTGQGPSTFLGYTMARIAAQDFVPFHQIASAARRRGLGGKPLTWDKLVLLGLRLTHLVRTLHRFGYAVGDLNDRNVLVSRRLTPLLMDTDSFQVPRPGGGHFPSIVGDQLYWAPELLAVDLATYKGSRVEGDRYALGVLLFQLFLGGLRPYQSRGSLVDGLETLADKAKAGHYPWIHPKRGVLEPPASAPDYQVLPASLRAAFERCFVAGHRKPGKRPSADDWHAVLSRLHATGFKACPRNAGHVFGADQRSCPWCVDVHDPFDVAPKRRVPAVRHRRPVLVSAAPAKPGTRGSRPPQLVPAAGKPVTAPRRTVAKPAHVAVPVRAKRPARRPKGHARRRQPRLRVRLARHAAWAGYALLAAATAILAWQAA